MWDSCPGWGRLLEADKNYHLLSQIVMTEGLGSDLVTKAKKSVSRFPKKSYVCVTVLDPTQNTVAQLPDGRKAGVGPGCAAASTRATRNHR